MTCILLIDDDAALTSLLRDYLETDGFSVRVENEAARGIEAAADDVAIAVLDVMMPQLNGLEVLRRIRERSELPVIMLTARGDDVDRITGLELGADDYVPKPCTPRELAARIRAILRRARPSAGKPGEGSELIASGNLRMWPEQRSARWAGMPLKLTSTEFSLLETLVRRAGHPVSKNDLSERALGRPLERHDRNIDVHISSIRRKLGTLSDGRPMIQAVHRMGYQLLKE